MSRDKQSGLGYRMWESAWRRKFWILLPALLAAICVSLFSVESALSTAVSYIRLDFESAHDGLTPGGTRFNIYDIHRESLLTRAIALTGLEGEMDWRELADCLTVAPSRTQSVSKRYIATEYKATLTSSKAFGRVSARSMLDVICRLYYEDFLRQSGEKHDQLNVDWDQIAEMEYAEISDFVKSRADILRQFLNNRIDNSDGYESEYLATSFRALLSTVENYQSVYIDKYTALISQSRLFRNATAYKTKLAYQRMLIDQSYKLSRAQFAIREQALNDYEESLIAIVMVPTYYQGSGLYMSRTQIGIDTLTKEAESYSYISQQQALKLARIDETIASLAASQTAAAAKADALIEQIARQYDILKAQIVEADETYSAYIARDYVSFEKRIPGIIEAYGAKSALIAACAVGACAALAAFLKDSRAAHGKRKTAKGGA